MEMKRENSLGYGSEDIRPVSAYLLAGSRKRGIDNNTSTHRMGSTHQVDMHHGGWAHVLVALASVVMLGVSGFTFYCTYHQVYVSYAAVTGPVINTANISAAIAAGSIVVSAMYAYALTLIGRHWLARRHITGQPISVGQWAAITSQGSFSRLKDSIPVGNGMFILVLLCYWAIPSVIVGALSPSIGPVIIKSEALVTRITGSGGNETADIMQRCDAGQPNSCPAATHPENVALALRNGLEGFGRYLGVGMAVAGDYLVPWQGGFTELDGSDLVGGYGVEDRGLANPLRYVTGWAPTTRPLVSCSIERDGGAVSLSGGLASFDTVCGRRTAG